MVEFAATAKAEVELAAVDWAAAVRGLAVDQLAARDVTPKSTTRAEGALDAARVVRVPRAASSQCWWVSLRATAGAVYRA